MQLNDATRIIDIIDQRIRRLTQSEARVETTWGEVAAVSADGRYADLYLYGNAAPYTSDYFRLPNGLSVNVGDSVKAAIDKERGDRWVEEVHSFSPYSKVEFDIVDGEVRLGDGTAAADTRLYRSAAKTLRLDDGAGGAATLDVLGALATSGNGTIGGGLTVTGGDIALGADVNLYRSATDVLKTDDDLVVGGGDITLGADVNIYRGAADVLKTDDVLHAVAGLRVTSPSSTDGQNFEAVRIVLPNNGYTGLAIYSSSTDTEPTFRWAGWGGMEFGPGGSTAPDTSLARTSAGVLKIDTSGAADQGLQIGDDAVLFDVGISDRLGIKGVQNGANGGLVFGSDKDTNLYRSAADTLKTDDSFEVGGDLHIAGSLGSSGSTTTFSINNGGTATFSNKSCEWRKYGRLVVFRVSFSVTANGSGTSGITLTDLGLPTPPSNTVIAGDRSGTGVKFLGARLDTTGTIAAVRTLDDASSVTGADLVNGATYSFNGAYLAAS